MNEYFEVTKSVAKELELPFPEQNDPWVFDFPLEPFLFGSRSFYEHTPESDWDFAVQFSEDREKLLLEKGWALKDFNGEGDYVDHDTISVFEKVVDGRKIQIALRRDVKRFAACWDQISHFIYKRHINKRSKEAWSKMEVAQYLNDLFSLYDRGKEAGQEDLKLLWD